MDIVADNVLRVRYQVAESALRSGRDPHDISPQPAEPRKKPLLNILPGNYAQPLTVVKAETIAVSPAPIT